MLRILLPIDFTESSDNVCDYTLRLAAKIPNVRVLLLHCFYDYLTEADTTMPIDAEITASEVITERVLYRNEAEAQEQLEQTHQRMLREAGAAGAHLHLEQAFMLGVAEEKIKEQIARFKPDLVLMGTKGETSFARSLFGTVTTEVIAAARVPVLTLPLAYEGKSINRVLYATDFDKADVKSITTLTHLLAPFQPNILCVHITDGENEQNRHRLQQLQEQLQSNASAGNIRYTLLDGDDVAETLQAFASREKIDLVALTTQEHSTWNRIFKPSLAKKLVLHAEVPLLIFHSEQF